MDDVYLVLSGDEIGPTTLTGPFFSFDRAREWSKENTALKINVVLGPKEMKGHLPFPPSVPFNSYPINTR